MTHPLILPLFVFVLFKFIFVLLMAYQRAQAVKKGEVDARYFKTYSEELKPAARQLLQYDRHHTNLYESPVLFYAAITLLVILSREDIWAQALAWGYVVARWRHAWVHVTSNKLLIRRGVFFISWLFLLGLWGLVLFEAF